MNSIYITLPLTSVIELCNWPQSQHAIGNVLQQHIPHEYTDVTAAKIKGNFICATSRSESNHAV